METQLPSRYPLSRAPVSPVSRWLLGGDLGSRGLQDERQMTETLFLAKEEQLVLQEVSLGAVWALSSPLGQALEFSFPCSLPCQKSWGSGASLPECEVRSLTR
jgi:hypothetical protein